MTAKVQIIIIRNWNSKLNEINRQMFGQTDRQNKLALKVRVTNMHIHIFHKPWMTGLSKWQLYIHPNMHSSDYLSVDFAYRLSPLAVIIAIIVTGKTIVCDTRCRWIDWRTDGRTYEYERINEHLQLRRLYTFICSAIIISIREWGLLGEASETDVAAMALSRRAMLLRTINETCKSRMAIPAIPSCTNSISLSVIVWDYIVFSL